MPNLLLEIFSEEIPARMQEKAEGDLKTALTNALKKVGLAFGDVTASSGPRRLCVHIADVAAASNDVTEERKGPKLSAPEKAIAGFLRGAGLDSIDEAQVRSDPKKGDFYVATKTIPGRPAPDLIAEIVPEIVTGFHWPKSMKWGRGTARWVRPLQRIVCVFGGEIVPFEVAGVTAGNETEGHRVLGRGPYTVTDWTDYSSQLEGAGHVRLHRAERMELIREQAQKVCKDAGLEWVEDEGLLREVTGLAEWPVVLLGQMDEAFLALPPEVIQLSMKTHQKYFAVRDPKSGKLAPNFVVVANLAAADGGVKIAAGNARVLSARLDDGRFFYENDKATGLEAMGEKLSTITFKEELGSIADKVSRVALLGRELAPKVGADADLAERAARLMKNDLVSEMVYEFPELQGIMGRYYALEAGEDIAVADAIAQHYLPQGPSDPVPSDPVAIAVALADKLDTLVGFWAIDQKPTGSKDPFALRRAALGVVRIILENGLRLKLLSVLTAAGEDISKPFEVEDLCGFITERLKQVYKTDGRRHDLIDAVFGLGGDDLVRLDARISALSAFLDTDNGTNLLAGYKRAANILKAEEKKAKTTFDAPVSTALLTHPAEIALHQAIETAQTAATAALETEDFAGAMSALAQLRGPVDAFFEDVIVNDEDKETRLNRLSLLTSIRVALHQVADFSKIDG